LTIALFDFVCYYLARHHPYSDLVVNGIAKWNVFPGNARGS